MMVPTQLIAAPVTFGKHLHEADGEIGGIPCISLWLFTRN